ncbi:MAG: HAD-IIA family hydrolase [Chloroflexi bacterium]|nr:MAG: HAD-IIA family hydrolase [Chloroflexota bacterium]
MSLLTLKPYQGYIFDLDGTVYLGDRVIPGASEVIQRLRERGSRIVFVSNKPLESRAAYAKKLTRLGIPTDARDVINSSLAMVEYLQQEKISVPVFAIGEQPLLDELTDAGYEISEEPEKIGLVIASFDRTFNYHKLNVAFQALKRGAMLFATNADATCPVEGGEIPDAGAVIGALKGCAHRDVSFIAGKPSGWMIQLALQMLNCPPANCLLTGDRLETDIQMGMSAGMDTALVLSGVSTRKTLENSKIKPTYVLESIA